MKIDPRHLEILAAIVDHGGLTEGASALGKSQPSVSRSLSMLEERLGIAPNDAMTYGAVSLCLATVALLACVLPARRAMRLDPADALKAD